MVEVCGFLESGGRKGLKGIASAFQIRGLQSKGNRLATPLHCRAVEFDEDVVGVRVYKYQFKR